MSAGQVIDARHKLDTRVCFPRAVYSIYIYIRPLSTPLDLDLPFDLDNLAVVERAIEHRSFVIISSRAWFAFLLFGRNFRRNFQFPSSRSIPDSKPNQFIFEFISFFLIIKLKWALRVRNSQMICQRFFYTFRDNSWIYERWRPYSIRKTLQNYTKILFAITHDSFNLATSRYLTYLISWCIHSGEINTLIDNIFFLSIYFHFSIYLLLRAFFFIVYYLQRTHFVRNKREKNNFQAIVARRRKR